MNFSYQTVNEKGNNKCNQYVMANFLIFHKICNIISKCVEQSHITRDGGNALKKHAILFVLIVCVVTVYGILSADHYFQLNNLEKQMELATGRIQSILPAGKQITFCSTTIQNTLKKTPTPFPMHPLGEIRYPRMRRLIRNRYEVHSALITFKIPGIRKFSSGSSTANRT